MRDWATIRRECVVPFMAKGDLMAQNSSSDSRVRSKWEQLILQRPGITIVALLILAIALGWIPLGNFSPAVSSDELQPAKVVRVVDGDTLVLSVNGADERVRLIGINCPESVAPEDERNTEEGVEASDFTKSLVNAGDTVWLEGDVNDRDQYDRLLRYVWLEKPDNPNDAQEIRTKMLNGILVAEGYAQARRYGDDTAHAAALEALGREAAEKGKGVSDFWD